MEEVSLREYIEVMLRWKWLIGVDGRRHPGGGAGVIKRGRFLTCTRRRIAPASTRSGAASRFIEMASPFTE